MEHLITNEVEDLYYEHSQHGNAIKGITGRKCSECYKEHLEIKGRAGKKIIPEPKYNINDYRINNA